MKNATIGYNSICSIATLIHCMVNIVVNVVTIGRCDRLKSLQGKREFQNPVHSENKCDERAYGVVDSSPVPKSSRTLAASRVPKKTCSQSRHE